MLSDDDQVCVRISIIVIFASLVYVECNTTGYECIKYIIMANIMLSVKMENSWQYVN